MNKPSYSYPILSIDDSTASTISGNTTLAVYQRNVDCALSGANITVTLPLAAQSAGLLYFIYISNIDTSYKATIVPSSSEPNYPNLIGSGVGSMSSRDLDETGEWVLLYSTGRYWIVVNSYEVP